MQSAAPVDLTGLLTSWAGESVAVAMLLIALWAFYTRRIVTGSAYREIAVERDEWKRLYLQAREVAARAVEPSEDPTRAVVDILARHLRGAGDQEGGQWSP